MNDLKTKHTDQQIALMIAMLEDISANAPLTVRFSHPPFELLAKACLLNTNEKQCNWDKVASKAGYTTGSAKVIWGNIKRNWKAAENGDGGGPAPTTPKKRKHVDGETSMPQKKATPKKAKKVEGEEVGVNGAGVKNEPIDDGGWTGRGELAF